MKPIETNWNQNRIGSHRDPIEIYRSPLNPIGFNGDQFGFDFNWFQLVLIGPIANCQLPIGPIGPNWFSIGKCFTFHVLSSCQLVNWSIGPIGPIGIFNWYFQLEMSIGFSSWEMKPCMKKCYKFIINFKICQLHDLPAV